MNLDRLERWARVNLMKFTGATCKVLYLGWGNPKHQLRLSKEWGLFFEDRGTSPRELSTYQDNTEEMIQTMWIKTKGGLFSLFVSY